MSGTTVPRGWRGGVALVALMTLAACGCGDAKRRIEASSNLKELSAALIAYHAANQAWPDNLDQIKPMIGKDGPLGVIGKGKDFAALVANPLTGDNPGYEYVKPKADAPNPAGPTIILYQLRGGKRDPSLPVAFADGSVRNADSAAP